MKNEYYDDGDPVTGLKSDFTGHVIGFLLSLVLMAVFVLAALYIADLKDQDNRIKYIEQTHSEIK